MCVGEHTNLTTNLIIVSMHAQGLASFLIYQRSMKKFKPYASVFCFFKKKILHSCTDSSCDIYLT